MKPREGIAFLALAAALGLAAAPARADTQKCPGINAVVTHDTAEELELVCGAVSDAAAFMRDNGFAVTVPISVSVVDHVSGSFPHRAVGAFNRASMHIEVLSYAECLKAPERKSGFRVPMTRDLHRSFVVHEVAHAILESNLGPKPPPLAQENRSIGIGKTIVCEFFSLAMSDRVCR